VKPYGYEERRPMCSCCKPDLLAGRGHARNEKREECRKAKIDSDREICDDCGHTLLNCTCDSLDDIG